MSAAGSADELDSRRPGTNERTRSIALPPGPRTFWRILAFAVVTIAVLLALAALAVWLRGRTRRADALERLRATGAPMLPDEIRFPERRPGRDPRQWIERYRACEWREQPPLASLPECAGTEGLLADGTGEGAFLEDLERALDDPRRARALTPCQRAAKRCAIAGDEEELAVALEADRLGEVDWAEIVAGGTELEDLIPDVFVAPGFKSVERLSDAAWEAADRGDFEQAVRRLGSMGKAAAFHERSPQVIGVSAWTVAQHSALHGIRRVLQIAPPGLDLSALEPLLEERDVLERIRFALEGERAIGNRVFEALRGGTFGAGDLADLPWLERWASDLLLDHGQANYLCRFERALAALRKGPDAAQLELEALDAEEPARYDLVTNLLCPRFAQLAQFGRQLEAYRTLTRARVIAYRDGTDVGLAWLATRTDPFGGAAYRHRRDPDGVITIWSIGRNLVDDQAPEPPWDDVSPESADEPPDLVVRFRAGEADASDGR